MLQAFGWTIFLKAGAVIAFAWMALLTAVGFPESVFARANSSLTLTVFTFVVLGAKWGLWRWLWRWIPALNRLVYPDLNGTWRGTLASNWPVIERMAKAAKGEAETFDPFSADGHTRLTEVPMTLRVEASWFKIHVRMETDSQYSNSRTLTVTPVRGENGDPHKLCYVFENESRDPVSTDSSYHKGTAWLSITNGDTATVLDGQVWTERNWRKGLNTAGLLRVERVSADPDAAVLAKVPENHAPSRT